MSRRDLSPALLHLLDEKPLTLTQRLVDALDDFTAAMKVAAGSREWEAQPLAVRLSLSVIHVHALRVRGELR